MAAPVVSMEDSLVLDLRKGLMERKRAFISWSNFERLFLWPREQGFVSDPAEVLSGEARSLVGECLMETLFADCSIDVGLLLVQWKKFDMVWREFGFCSSQSSQGDPSIVDTEEGEFEFLHEAEASPLSRDGELGDGSGSEGDVCSPKVDWAPSQLVPSSQRVGRAPRASGDPVEFAKPTRPAPHRKGGGAGGASPSLCAFLALGRCREPRLSLRLCLSLIR